MQYLITPILAIVNKSLDLGVVPPHLKRAKTAAIYKKKGDKTDPGNYRPISVLPLSVAYADRIPNPWGGV